MFYNMNEIAIRVQNLTKVYKLYEKPSNRLREVFHPLRKKYHRDFAALKDLSFEIEKGQVVGIIGKNGSGKSTLLKILTGVLTPSSGRVEVNGRIAALLELGAGFNPELTGRENIYLNGALMGYSHEQMDQRIQNIIEFADIGEFIEQPVKMYSSGMFVRLAFAVAINVDPDILIIDEALSVGDIRFQQKCIRKIQEFFEKGKTVLFVGHDLAAINSFCSICFWIHEGQLISQGEPKDITKEYTSFMAYGMISNRSVEEGHKVEMAAAWQRTASFSSFGDREALIQSIRVYSENGVTPASLWGGELVSIEMKIECQKRIENPIIGFIVKNRLGHSIFGGNTFGHKINISPMEPPGDTYKISFKFPYLSNGEYTLTLAVADGNQYDHVQKHWVHDCFVFSVNNPNIKYQNGDGLVLENNFYVERSGP